MVEVKGVEPELGHFKNISEIAILPCILLISLKLLNPCSSIKIRLSPSIGAELRHNSDTNKHYHSNRGVVFLLGGSQDCHFEKSVQRDHGTQNDRS